MHHQALGESAQYDFAIEYQGHFLRVQVKSTKLRRESTLRLQCVHPEPQPYGVNQIDFVAAYVIPLDIWYIIPAHAFQGPILYLISHPI